MQSKFGTNDYLPTLQRNLEWTFKDLDFITKYPCEEPYNMKCTSQLES